MKVCVIIPVFNESAKIGGVIQQIRRKDFEVVVIDDGSTDNTAIISRDNGAIVLKNPENQGKGYSLIRGLRYILEKDFDAVITMDGDGQHSPDDIPAFINKAQTSDAGIIIGNRMSNPSDMPPIRVLTNKFMSVLISKLVKQKIADTQCGFRLIKKQLLEDIKLNPLACDSHQSGNVKTRTGLTTKRFETESEILFQASLLGYRIESIPIKSIYQKEKSQINPFLDTIRFISFICRQLWIMRS